MQMSEKLGAQKRRAVGLLSETPRGGALVLRVLSELTDNEISEYEKNRCFSEAALDRIANVLGYPTTVIETTVLRNIAPGLEDYRHSYQLLQNKYHLLVGKGNDKTVRSLFDSSERAFMLYNCIHIWSPDSGSLGGYGLEDDELYDLAKGFLASEGKAFQDSVELLEESMIRKWDRWQDLWKYF